MSAQAFGQFTLGHPGSDPQRDEHLPESMEVQNFSDLTPTEPFIAGHLYAAGTFNGCPATAGEGPLPPAGSGSGVFLLKLAQ